MGGHDHRNTHKITACLTIDEGGQPYKLPYVGNAENVVTVEGR